MIYRKAIGVIMLILLIPALLAGCGVQDQDLINAQKLLEYNKNKYKDHEATGDLIDGVRVINIQAWQFFFEPSLIIVNKGEKVKLVIEAMDIPHGFEIEGFEIPNYDINTVIRKGFPLSLEFIADEEGVWDFICSIYCGFGHSTMKGTWVTR